MSGAGPGTELKPTLWGIGCDWCDGWDRKGRRQGALPEFTSSMPSSMTTQEWWWQHFQPSIFLPQISFLTLGSGCC